MSLGIYGDGGSMRGSGIYSQDISFDAFVCENEECGKSNEAGDTVTDDWGNYSVECKFCKEEYKQGNIISDQDDRDEN